MVSWINPFILSTQVKIRTVNIAAWLALSLTLPAPLVLGHDGLHEQLKEVTARIKREPRNASLYLRRGELLRLHRDWNRAAADYDRAARLDPALTIVDLARGKMLFEAGRLRVARIALDRFLKRQPANVEALATRARVLVKIGSRIEGARDFTQAVAHSTTPQPELYLERAQALAGAGARYVDEALRGIDEGIEKLGPLVTLQLCAIELELRLSSYDAALGRLDRIAAQSPRKETWLVRRGEILAQAGRKDEARRAFIAALAAIQSLPSHRRQTRAILDLETHARAALAQ